MDVELLLPAKDFVDLYQQDKAKTKGQPFSDKSLPLSY